MNVLAILHRNIKWRFHNALTIIITILQPMLWLVMYSSVAGSTMQNTGIKNYTAFILPGLIVLVSFGVCSSGGIMNYLMKNDGSFYRILIAPIHRSSIVLGQLLEAVLCSFFEVTIMVIVSLFFSVRIPLNISIILYIIILIFLMSFFMAGICYAISLILPNEVMYETVMNAIVLPIFFLSTALFPANNIHGALAIAIHINPFTHVINILRSFILYERLDIGQMIFVMILYMILGCISFLWAHHKLKKETNL